jgi:hypothetical protein
VVVFVPLPLVFIVEHWNDSEGFPFLEMMIRDILLGLLARAGGLGSHGGQRKALWVFCIVISFSELLSVFFLTLLFFPLLPYAILLLNSCR